ncbi:MAG: chemotaxis protein CheW [Smithellaceae bacterium]|nr:chemotaxis protein CheW [Smithellaceae bacterium]
MGYSFVAQSAQSGTTGKGVELLQFVTFKLGDEEYAIDILQVREINIMKGVTKIPSSPSYVEGVVSQRGKVIPVVSLRKKFGLPAQDHRSQAKIMIIEISGVNFGVIVDSVEEVLRIPSDVVEPPPPLAVGKSCEFIMGIAKLEERLIILVELGRLLAIEELALLVHEEEAA